MTTDKKTLTPEQRRRDIAHRDYESGFTLKNVALAQIYGVADNQIWHDRKHPTYKEELLKLESGAVRARQRRCWKLFDKLLDKWEAEIDNGDYDYDSMKPKTVESILSYRASCERNLLDAIKWHQKESGAIALETDATNNSTAEDRLMQVLHPERYTDEEPDV